MYKYLRLKSFHNSNGLLTAAEFKSIKFNIKRVFSIIAKKNSIRGKHAHKKCRQIFFCPSGKVELHLFDGKIKKRLILSKRSGAIIINKKVWVELKFLNNNTFLVVLCDQYFSEKDYIRDFSSYKRLFNK